ncbi:MAG TPA: rhombotarget lipoprotein [Gemmatimonadaceae bacterium]|nr:rhombotarget lipoprotein [Gemmatimonadaceae bacterium]
MRDLYRSSSLAVAAAALSALAACAAGPERHATSVMNYLYPDRGNYVETPAVPVLSLPLRVGVAFVPEPEDGCGGRCVGSPFPEADRMALLQRVADHFRDSSFVKSIEIIPSAYLAPRGSFANLDQLRQMFGVDVIALVSYDQIQFHDQKRTSLTYWTIVGAYLVEGEKQDTRTLMDAVVYDIPSRRLLFRAPGLSTVKGSSTPVNLTEEMRRDREKGFRLASDELIANIDRQLPIFRERVRRNPAEFRVVPQPEYRGGTRGGGSADGWTLLLVAALGGAALLGRRGAVRG